jgi:hypothetical protein
MFSRTLVEKSSVSWSTMLMQLRSDFFVISRTSRPSSKMRPAPGS